MLTRGKSFINTRCKTSPLSCLSCNDLEVQENRDGIGKSMDKIKENFFCKWDSSRVKIIPYEAPMLGTALL